MRCSSDGPACNAVALRAGEAEGDGVCAGSGETNAMTPIRKKIRIITRPRYTARIYHGKKNAIVLQRVEDNAFH